MKLEAFRQLTDTLRQRPPGINASVNKLVTCELNHQLARAALEVLGDYGWLAKQDARVADDGAWPQRLHVRARPHHRRRHGAGAEEHHRRARARHAAGGAARVSGSGAAGPEKALTD